MGMHIQPYREAAHYAQLCEWWVGHGQEPTPPDGLPGDGRPGFGCVVPGVAAGFIYETGTSLWLGPHCLLVNPALHAAAEHVADAKVLGDAALDAIVETLETLVARRGGGALASFTTDRAVIARARRHGYRLTGQHVAFLGKVIAGAGAANGNGVQAQPSQEAPHG